MAVSVTIRISVQNRHSRILLRVLSCSRVREMHREPEVPDAGATVVERLDGLARITLEELAPIHCVNNGILRSACSTCQKMDLNWWMSALTHTARLTNSQARILNRMVKNCSGYIEEYTTIGLRISGYGAAEVFIDLTEELYHIEANPMCKK